MKNGEIISVNKLNLKNNRKFDIEVKGPHVYFADGILVHNCKMDGLYNSANCSDDAIQFVTRQGSYLPMDAFADIQNELSHIKLKQIHGEIIVEEDGKILPRQIGNGIINSILKGDGKFSDNQRPIYVAWDIIPLEYAKKKSKYKVSYDQRLKELESLLMGCSSVQVIEYKVVHSIEECYEHASELIQNGFEGTVFKDPDMPWEDGTSKWQVKIKLEFDSDLEIYDITNGREGSKLDGLPAVFNCRSIDDKLFVDVTIKNDELRARVIADQDYFLNRIIEVVAADLMRPGSNNKNHSLYLPRMKEADIRHDKNIADTLERIEDSYEMAKRGVR